jgi:hypothetical protein
MPQSVKPVQVARRRTPWERLGSAALPVSCIAEQSYCEHRLHLWLKEAGRRTSVPRSLEDEAASRAIEQAAQAGIEFHARAAAGASPMLIDDARKLLRRVDSIQLLESQLEAAIEGTPIIGILDAACAESGSVRCVLDYTVTDSNQLQMTHRVQLELYAWLLEESKFKLKDLLLVKVLVPLESKERFESLDEATRRQLASTLHAHARNMRDSTPSRDNWYDKRFEVTPGFWVRLRVFEYLRSFALQELQFSMQYWLGRRLAIPSRNVRKCQQCLYGQAGTCTKAAHTQRWL